MEVQETKNYKSMIEVKFSICDEVFYLNTASEVIESDRVKGIQIVPTGIYKDENGEDVCDGIAILYSLRSGIVLSESEVFASEEDCRVHLVSLVQRLSEV